jgi:hypothetical protein
MEKEKKEEIREEIVVLDQGIDIDDLPIPTGMCCSGPFTPFRW